MPLPQNILDLIESMTDIDVIVRKRGQSYSAMRTYPTFGSEVVGQVPVPEPEPTTVIMRVITTSLNVRKEPKVSSDVLRQLRNGDEVEVLANFIKDENNNIWMQLKTSGYVAYKYNGQDYLAPKDSINGPASLSGRYQLKSVNNTYRITRDGDSRPTFWVNIRELAFPQAPDYPYYTSNHQRDMLDELNRIGVRGVRFYAPHKKLSYDDNLKAIESTLDLLNTYNLSAMIVLGDSIGVTNFAHDQVYHTYSSLGHLNMDWYKKREWQKAYMSWLKLVVAKFANHPALFSWQLMNEPTINQGRTPTSSEINLFTEFVDEASGEIYKLDTKHPISIGVINSSAFRPVTNDANWFSGWLGQRDHIHLANVHIYQNPEKIDDHDEWEHEPQGLRDLDDAQIVGRAGMIDEFGSSGGNRVNATDRLLQKAYIGFGGNACMCAQWGFMFSKAHQDFGIGDGIYGWDDSLEGTKYSYEDMKALYIHWIITNLSRQV